MSHEDEYPVAVDKSIWGSPAGKRHLAKRLVEAIPPHRVYVEPFAGGAQVLFAKEPSDVEVVSDFDKEIAFAFKFVRDVTDEQIDQLRRKKWVGDKTLFKKLHKAPLPDDPVERFYSFAYIARFSFNGRRQAMAQSAVGTNSRFVDKLERFAPRLRKIRVRSGDYVKVIREFDGPDAFFFLDPPYAGYDAIPGVGTGHKDWDEARFGEELRRIKGKFLVTYGVRGAADLFKGFNVQRWRHLSGVGAGCHGNTSNNLAYTLIVTNYDTKANRGGFSLSSGNARDDAGKKRSIAKVLRPSLKVPDPDHLVSRLAKREVAGILSRVDRAAFLDKDFILVNERLKEGEPTKAWGVVRLRTGVRFRSGTQAVETLGQKLDALTRREFRQEKDPVHFHSLMLVERFDPPKEVEQQTPGRRFTGQVDVADMQKADVRITTSTDAGHSHTAIVDEDTGDGETTVDSGHKHGVDNWRVLPGGTDNHIHTIERPAVKGQFALVAASGEEAGEVIKLDDVLPAFQTALLRKPAVMLVGGLAVRKETKNDIDILIRGPMDEATRHVIKFRVGRMLAAKDPELADRIQFHDDQYGGPFTDFVELFDLALVARDKPEVVQMRAVEKQGDPLLELLPKGAGPADAVYQLHYRGASVHGDLRMKINDHLVGWTMAVQKAGAVPDTNTVEQGKKGLEGLTLEGNRIHKSLLAPSRVRAFPKKRQPVVWLEAQDQVIDPGDVGATAEEEGVLIVADRPKFEQGIQSSRFHEYFFTGKGKLLQGVMFSRLLASSGGTPQEEEEGRRTREGETFWVTSFSKNALPSILSKRAVDRGDMPPSGRSWIPKTLEQVTPEEFRYWEKTGAAAKAARDALVKARFFTDANVKMVDGQFRRVIEKRFIDLKGVGPSRPAPPEPVVKQQVVDFSLAWQTFKGQDVVRTGPSKQGWWLMWPVDGRVASFLLATDPVAETGDIAATFVEMADKELMTFEGALEPGQRVAGFVPNPTKDTPSQWRIVDKGKMAILDEEPGKLRFSLKGENLEGIFVLEQEERGSAIWKLKRESVEKRIIPFYSWGGSALYARRIVDGLPAHKVYVEPFCGSAAVFFAKESAHTTVLSDKDPELVHTLQFIQRIDEKSLGRLKRFDWVVSRSGFEKAKAYQPTSPDGRFWRFMYGRLASWGGMGIAHGYKPSGEGKKYDLEELLKFRDKLRGVTITQADWKDTIRRYDSPDTLFFVDPPYIDEWVKDDGGIEAGEIAKVLRSTKGKWLFVYTDSPSAKDAFKDIGKPFRLKVAETSSSGQGVSRQSRLFVRNYAPEAKAIREAKSTPQFKAVVLDRSEHKYGWTYSVGVGPLPPADVAGWKYTAEVGGETWVSVGKIFGCKVDAKPGKTIRVDVAKLLLDTKDQRSLTWSTPVVKDVIEGRPSTTKEVEALARPDEIDKLADLPFTRPLPLLKSDALQYVLGIVLEPNDGKDGAPLAPDAQSDVYSEDEVRKAAWLFMRKYQGLGLMHEREATKREMEIVESFVAPVEFVLNGQTIRKGTWLLGAKIHSPDLWKKIKRGEIGAWSIDGEAVRQPLDAKDKAA